MKVVSREVCFIKSRIGNRFTAHEQYGVKDGKFYCILSRDFCNYNWVVTSLDEFKKFCDDNGGRKVLSVENKVWDSYECE